MISREEKQACKKLSLWHKKRKKRNSLPHKSVHLNSSRHQKGPFCPGVYFYPLCTQYNTYVIEECGNTDDCNTIVSANAVVFGEFFSRSDVM